MTEGVSLLQLTYTGLKQHTVEPGDAAMRA